MNDLERRLSDLLHAGAPEPERTITPGEIARLAQHAPMPRRRITKSWGVPLLAAAAVLVAVGVPAVVIGHTSNSATPTSHSVGGLTPAPTAAGSPSPTGSGTSRPSPTTRITAGAVATCLTGQLRLAAGPTNGAAGSLYTSLSFTNTTGTSCSMRGFPGVSLLNDAGVIVGQPATRDGSAGSPVRLGPGQRAQFIIRVGTATRTGCTVPRPSSQIEVYPPGQTVALRIPFATGSCAMSVQSVLAAK
ncbi:MAG: DUF4232 domain-containing protein [Actinomycetota bacterium]